LKFSNHFVLGGATKNTAASIIGNNAAAIQNKTSAVPAFD